MNIRPDQTVVIGDQMLTDVFGGNRRGLYTIMVVQLNERMALLLSLID